MDNWRVDREAVYLCDNGAAYCGAHLGASAAATGRDISGQAVAKVTPEAAAEAVQLYGWRPACEQCGREAALVVTP